MHNKIKEKSIAFVAYSYMLNLKSDHSALTDSVPSTESNVCIPTAKGFPKIRAIFYNKFTCQKIFLDQIHHHHTCQLQHLKWYGNASQEEDY